MSTYLALSLPRQVEQKLSGQVQASDVASITLDDIRYVPTLPPFLPPSHPPTHPFTLPLSPLLVAVALPSCGTSF
jgi:hypothetical protein